MDDLSRYLPYLYNRSCGDSKGSAVEVVFCRSGMVFFQNFFLTTFGENLTSGNVQMMMGVLVLLSCCTIYSFLYLVKKKPFLCIAWG